MTFAATVVLVSPATAQDDGAGPMTNVNVLDGQRFVGEFVPGGEPAGRPDAFIFSDGKFHSRECLKFGFTPGPYWVRSENGRLHFLARLTSEENGVMTYEGSVVGSAIDARVEWVKPRWYWTMKRDLSFRGRSDADTAAGRK